MADRSIWQDIYGIEVTTPDAGVTLATHVATDPDFAATKTGIQGNGADSAKFALPLTDHANLKSPSGSIDSEQARGISPRHLREYNTVQTGEPAEFTLPMEAHAYNIAAMLPLFFQSGASEAAAAQTAANNVLSNIPYVVATTDTWAHIVRFLQPTGGAGDIDQLASGTLAASLTFTGETGGVLNMEAVMKAAEWAQKDLSGVVGNVENSFDIEKSLKYQDSTIAFLDVFTTTKEYTDAVGDLQFAAAGRTITVAAPGDFTVNGLAVGDKITVVGSALNDGQYEILTITDVGITGRDNTITLVATDTLVDEGPDAVATIAKAEWVDVKSPTISFTLTNNVVFNFYNDDVAVSAHLGRLTVEGSVTIPYSQATIGVGQAAGETNYMITRFLAGDPLLIAWFWGISGAAVDFSDDVYDDYRLDPPVAMDRYKNDAAATNPDSFFSLVVNVRVTDYEMAGDNELMTECTLVGVTDTVWAAVSAYCHYAGSKLDRLT